MNAPNNPWSWWQAALTDPKKIGSKDLPVSEGAPQQGYYRLKRQKSEGVGWGAPVAIIAKPDGSMVSKIGPWAEAIEHDAAGIWVSCCRFPISFDLFKAVAIRGEAWPDSITNVLVEVPGSAPAAGNGGDGREIALGDNSGEDPEDIFQQLKTQFEELSGRALAEVQKIGKPSSAAWSSEWDVKSDRVANYADAIAKIGKRIDEAFTEEKKPHLEAGRAVDEKWRAVKTKRDETVKKLKKISGDLLKAKRDFEAESRRRAEEAARIPIVAGLDLPHEEPKAADPIKVKAGTTGRTISLVKRSVANIVDPVVFVKPLLDGVAMPPHPEVMEVLQRIAQRMVSGGAHKVHPIPGVEVEEVEVAR